MNKFTVISAPEFINNGPAFGSAEYREAIQQEQLDKTQRLARQQRQIDEWQARKAQMTEREMLMNEISTLNDMKHSSTNSLACAEAVFQKLVNGEKTSE